MRPFGRRLFLKGAGATLALPFMESFGGEKVFSEAPTRFISMFMPNGAQPADWTPKGTGEDFTLSPILKQFADIKSDILVVSGLTNGQDDDGEGHNVSSSGFLTGRNHTTTEGDASIDHLIAEKIGRDSRLSHLRVGTEPPRSKGYLNCASVSWANSKTLLFPELNPRIAFDRMFRDFDSPEAKARAKRHKSVVDIVLSDAKDLHHNLSSYDKDKLDQYVTAIRGVERRLDKIMNPVATKHASSTQPGNDEKVRPHSGLPTDPEVHMDLMTDMVILGLWTNTTNVATFMMAHGLSRKGFAFLDGVNNDHHVCSHHSNDEKILEEYRLIVEWHVGKAKKIITKLADIDEGGKSMLHNSLLLFGSGMSDGDLHSRENMPMFLAGQAGGKVKTGRHLAFNGDQHSNLLLGITNVMGLENVNMPWATKAIDLG